MLYRNSKTGATIDVTSEIKGENWQAVEPVSEPDTAELDENLNNEEDTGNESDSIEPEEEPDNETDSAEPEEAFDDESDPTEPDEDTADEPEPVEQEVAPVQPRKKRAKKDDV